MYYINPREIRRESGTGMDEGDNSEVNRLAPHRKRGPPKGKEEKARILLCMQERRGDRFERKEGPGNVEEHSANRPKRLARGEKEKLYPPLTKKAGQGGREWEKIPCRPRQEEHQVELFLYEKDYRRGKKSMEVRWGGEGHCLC